MSTQVFEHIWSVVWHTHVPPRQVESAGHTTPQPPQLSGSVEICAQAVPQSMVPAAQTQAACAQT
jgi:hypothetical protein